MIKEIIEARLKRIVRLFNETEYSSQWDCMLDSIIRIEEKYFHCENCVFNNGYVCTQDIGVNEVR